MAEKVTAYEDPDRHVPPRADGAPAGAFGAAGAPLCDRILDPVTRLHLSPGVTALYTKCSLMKRLAVLASAHANGAHYNLTAMGGAGGGAGANVNEPAAPLPVPAHGVNVLLGGAMLSGIILVIFMLCYCCHKTNRKSQPPGSYWANPRLSMEIYTVEAAQNVWPSEDYPLSAAYDRAPPSPGLPPAYDSVVHECTNAKVEPEPIASGRSPDDSGLPSYDAAVRQLRLGGVATT